mgnify:CR=1 FL=1
MIVIRKREEIERKAFGNDFFLLRILHTQHSHNTVTKECNKRNSVFNVESIQNSRDMNKNDNDDHHHSSCLQ